MKLNLNIKCLVRIKTYSECTVGPGLHLLFLCWLYLDMSDCLLNIAGTL